MWPLLTNSLTSFSLFLSFSLSNSHMMLTMCIITTGNESHACAILLTVYQVMNMSVVCY